MKTFKFLIIFFVCTTYAYTQTYDDNPNCLKYWYYRDRLKYFVVPGSGENHPAAGESHIFDIRNVNVITGDISVGQHGKYLGLYLGVLATEYYLLAKNNYAEDAKYTAMELYYALEMYKEQMDKTPLFDDGYSFNGFFVRENFKGCDADPHNNFFPFVCPNQTPVISPTLSQKEHVFKLNRNIDEATNGWSSSTWTYGNIPAGHPGYAQTYYKPNCSEPPTNNYMSQDEAIGILLGLALIYKYGPQYPIYVNWEHGNEKYPFAQGVTLNSGIQYNFKVEAQTIFEKICTWIKTSSIICGVDPSGNWKISTPPPLCYQLHPNEGGDAQYYKWGFETAYGWIHGGNDWKNYNDRIGWNEVTYPFLLASTKIDNRSMACTLGAIGDSWNDDNTGDRINTLMNNYEVETYYLLLWAALHPEYKSSSRVTGTFVNTEKQINAAPPEGPYCYKSAYHWEGPLLIWPADAHYPTGDNLGWASTYKLYKELEVQKYGDSGWDNGNNIFWGNYNGLDYMLLYNLYHVVKDNISTEYYNRRYRRITQQCFPFIENGSEYGSVNHHLNLYSLESILSDAKIHNHTIDIYCSDLTNNTPGYVTYTAENKIQLGYGFTVEKGAYFSATTKKNILYSDISDPDNLGHPFDNNGIGNMNNSGPHSHSEVQNNQLTNTGNNNDLSGNSFRVFPNPFSNSTTINYNISKDENVKICIYDITNKKVAELVNEKQNASTHKIIFDGSNLEKGIYFCTIETEGYKKTEKIALIK